jgi:tRNA(fMet)-specific endonuclease VapC
MIFLLDTNTFCEPLKAEPSRRVISRLVARQFDWAVSATAWEEFMVGIQVLPQSARRRRLEEYRRELMASGLVVLPFDQIAADWMASERARLIRKGVTPAYRDAQIAAVAASRKLVLVTRNTRDFVLFTGLRVQNWFG